MKISGFTFDDFRRVKSVGEIRIQGSVHDIRVVRRGNTTYMRFGLHGGWQGALHHHHPSRPVFPYQRAFSAVIPRIGDVGSFLSVGVGTGTSLLSVQRYFPHAQLYGVDIDEHVIKTAIQYFSAPSYDKASYFVGDGLQYIKNSVRKFNLMFIDAYMSNQIYSPALEMEVLQWVYDGLSDTGTACFNVITHIPPHGRIKEWFNRAKKRFPSTFIVPVGVPYTSQNTLMICSKSPQLSGSNLGSALRYSSILSPWERLTWPMRIRS